MATLEATVKSILTGDATLMALLTGSVFNADDIVSNDFGGWDWAPKETDGLTLKPHAKLRWGESPAFQTENIKLSAENQTLEIYLYQDLGYATIKSAASRIKVLLHDQHLFPDDRAVAHLICIFISGELMAEEYHHKPCIFVRFSIIHIRK